jgi:glycine dehydrogenase subunit 1
MAYIQHTESDVREMLARIGVPSIDALFADIPEEIRFRGDLDIPPAMSELELRRHLEDLYARNLRCDELNSFLGAGAYQHFIPAVVDALASRGEFLTAYTPYQPEASQGMLTAIFEFQSMICRLTGMEVANASMYDGATALAEALLTARAHQRKRDRVVLSGAIHPEYRETVRTYLANLDVEVVELEVADGRTDPDALAAAADDRTIAVAFQSPSFFGSLEDGPALTRIAQDAGALVVAVVNPVSLGVLEPPGAYGADIVVGEGQPLGAPLSYGGPYYGFFAAREKLVRKMPGRIVGQTVDQDGRRGFVLTLSTREQHIRREKATSNICTNQGLIALRGAITMAVLGPVGLREMGSQCLQKAHYAAERIREVSGWRLVHEAPFFHEFVIEGPRRATEVVEALSKRCILPGVPLGRWFPARERQLLVAVTEVKTRAQIDALVAGLAEVSRA